MQWQLRLCPDNAAFHFWSFLKTCTLFVLCMSIYHGLLSICGQLHSALRGGYFPGSVLLINSPNEQVAVDIARAVMERRLAAGVNILPRTSTMFYWKDEIQYSHDILMLVKTKTSKVKELTDYVRSIHPYSNPEILSFPVEGGSLDYMKWVDEVIRGH